MSPDLVTQCLALVERVLAAQGDAAEPELIALQHALTAEPSLSPRSVAGGDLFRRLGFIAAAAPFGDAEWNRTLQEATTAMDDLAVLLRRTSRRMDPRDPLRSQAVACLKSFGLAGNPLRGVNSAKWNPSADLTDMREAGVLAPQKI